jgi:hypothetical protein
MIISLTLFVCLFVLFFARVLISMDSAVLLDCLVDSLHALGELASVQATLLWTVLAASPRHIKGNLVLAHLLGIELQSQSSQSQLSHGSVQGIAAAATSPAPPLWWSHAVSERKLRVTIDHAKSSTAFDTEQSLVGTFALWLQQHRQLVSQLRMCVWFL